MEDDQIIRYTSQQRERLGHIGIGDDMNENPYEARLEQKRSRYLELAKQSQQESERRHEAARERGRKLVAKTVLAEPERVKTK